MYKKIILAATAVAAATAAGVWRVYHRYRLDRSDDIQRSVTVDTSAASLEQLIRDVRHWHGLVHGVDTVEQEGIDRWRIRLSDGDSAHVSVSEIGTMTRFHVTGAGPVAHLDGLMVRPDAAPGDLGVEVYAALPGPTSSGLLASLTGTDPASMVDVYLRRLKQRAEVGFVMTVTGQPSARSGVSARAQDLIRQRLQAGGRR